MVQKNDVENLFNILTKGHISYLDINPENTLNINPIL